MKRKANAQIQQTHFTPSAQLAAQMADVSPSSEEKMEAYQELATLPSRRNSKPDGRRPQRRPVKTGPAKPAEPAEPLGADPLRPWMEKLSRELNSIRSEMGILKRQVAS